VVFDNPIVLLLSAHFYMRVLFQEKTIMDRRWPMHWLNENACNETFHELTWNVPFTGHFFIQPDFQDAINTSGTAEKSDNCFAASYRFGIAF